jgi:superoxide dismutase
MSVLEKSYPKLNGRDLKAIYALNIPRDIKDNAIYLYKYIKSHDLFFNSFSRERLKCNNIRKYYSSRERLVYEIFEISKANSHGFIYVYIDDRKGPKIDFSSDFANPYSKYEPCLAIDLYEHTYFADYGFAKEKFLRKALQYLNLELLDVKLS